MRNKTEWGGDFQSITRNCRLSEKMATAEVVAGAVKSFQEDGKGKKEEGAVLEPKDFFWDQFLKYISSAILALTVLNVSVEFLRGGGVQCFPPTVTRCDSSIRSL